MTRWVQLQVVDGEALGPISIFCSWRHHRPIDHFWHNSHLDCVFWAVAMQRDMYSLLRGLGSGPHLQDSALKHPRAPPLICFHENLAL